MVAFFSSHLVTHNPLRSDFLDLYFSKVNIFHSSKNWKKTTPLPQPRFSGYLVTSYSQYQVLDQVWKPEEQLSTQECSGNDQLS